jgi:hypothetical protein
MGGGATSTDMPCDSVHPSLFEAVLSVDTMTALRGARESIQSLALYADVGELSMVLAIIIDPRYPVREHLVESGAVEH